MLLIDFYSEYQRQISDPLSVLIEKAGYGLVVAAGAHVPGEDSPDYTRKGRNAIYDVVKSFNAQGIILMTPSVCHDLGPSEITEFIEEFPLVPLVCIGQSVNGANSLTLDNEFGMSECMRFLLEASENQSFAFVGGVKGNKDSDEREEVFRRLLAEAGKEVDENLVVFSDFLAAKAYQVVLELIAKRQDVDVIVCANDESAIGAIHALNALGLSVPEDIRVTGFDDSADTTRSRPTISSVTQSYQEIAVRSVDILFESMSNRSSVVKSESIKTEFIARESSLCASQTNVRENFPESDYAERSQALAKRMVARLRRPGTAISIPEEQLFSALFESGCGNAVPMERCIEQHLDLHNMRMCDVVWWQELTSVIESHGNQLPNSGIYDILRECLTTSVHRIHEIIRQWRIRQEFENRRVNQINQYFLADLSVATSQESLCELLRTCVSQLGVQRAYMILYSEIHEQPCRKSRVVLYHSKNNPELCCEQELFNTAGMLPPSIEFELKKGMLVAHSISLGGLQFGYFMIDPIPDTEMALDLIVDGLGSALLHMNQVEQMNLHTEHLQNANKQLFNLANYDELTQLPNRAHFKNKLQETLIEAAQSGREVALAFLDLDGFKIINDSLGHTAGDCLLKIVADRLTAVLGHEALISRLGGDEFTIIFTSDSATEKIIERINIVSVEILNTLSSPYELQQNVVNVSASVGVAIFPNDSQEMEGLIRKADVAMYNAKFSGKNCLRLYTSDLDSEYSNQLEQDQKMRTALVEDKFYLVYQPKFCLSDYSIVGAEALLRWHNDDPSDTSYMPGEFIPIAERTGFITQLDEFVLNSACIAIKQWAQKNIALPVAVNLSAVHMHTPKFVAMVAECIERHSIDPGLLEIEVTESAAMEDVEQSVVQLTKLQALGISISIDDFGTGYSSLSYLKRLPVDTLKIDKSFLRDVRSGSDLEGQDAAICKAIIALGRSMHYNVLAEGVEHEFQHDMLLDLGCHEGQGYYYSHPLPHAAYTKLLLNHAPSIAV